MHVTAIESHAGGPDFTWRAISVVPSSNFLREHGNSSQQDLANGSRPNLRDTPEINVDRVPNFGNMEIGTEKDIVVEVRNVGTVDDQLLSDARFVNLRSNFEIRNQTFPVLIPPLGSISINVYLK